MYRLSRELEDAQFSDVERQCCSRRFTSTHNLKTSRYRQPHVCAVSEHVSRVPCASLRDGLPGAGCPPAGPLAPRLGRAAGAALQAAGLRRHLAHLRRLPHRQAAHRRHGDLHHLPPGGG